MLPKLSQHPADPRLSPYTGWTRAHWEAVADQLLLAVRPYASTGNALIALPGPASRSGAWSDGLEGFARTFLLAAFRLAGAGGRDPHGLAGWYADGVAAGTDPASPERWPRLDEVDQAKVEAASIAIALHETRPWIWDRLDDGVRARVLDWLAAHPGAWVPDNNWVWFRAVAAAFCRASVIALHGTMNAGVRRPAAPHAFGRHAAIPFLRSAGPVRPGETYAAAVALSGDPAGPGEPPRLTAGPGAAGTLAVVIRWADGEQDRLTL